MSENVHEAPMIDAEPAKPVTAPEDTLHRSERARLDGYRRRFAGVYVVLALVAGLGAGALIVVLERPDGSARVTAPAWSSFKPSGSTNARSKQIAKTVSERYKLSNGQQLVGAIPGPPIVVSNQPEGSTQILIRAIAVRPDIPVGGELSGRDLEIVDSSNSLQYVLCGYGEGCSIATGQPSVERHLLLRREALELALYTFKYLGRINSIVVFLPPPPGGQVAPTAVFLRRSELGNQLARPLEQTLSRKTPGIGRIAPAEADMINRITSKRLYQFNYTQAQDGGAVMLLDPVVTPG